jgi:hypothetical protein
MLICIFLRLVSRVVLHFCANSSSIASFGCAIRLVTDQQLGSENVEYCSPVNALLAGQHAYAEDRWGLGWCATLSPDGIGHELY